VRRTKIVATLGPATDSYERVRAMVEAGMDVARLNFSHGDHDTHRRWFEWVRRASEETGRNVAVLQDIQGPKLRVGRFPDGGIELAPGTTVTLVPDDVDGGDRLIPISYPHLTEDVKEGHRIVLADGLIVLEVTGVASDSLSALVRVGGILTDRKGAAFPDSDLRTPAVTPKDEEDLEFGRELGVDWVAASFVRTGDDVRQVQALCGLAPVIAKIELAVAYRNLDEILAESDGVMIARGDLGVQLPLERIPIVQAEILSRANAVGRITITATEMLESMTHNQRPTRAEVTDVVNAVVEGTDAVMLSGETAVGEYPIRAVEMMARICAEAESSPHARRHSVPFLGAVNRVASAVARAATEAAADLGIGTIVAFTESGSTARLISKYRPEAAVVAFSPNPSTRRRMALYWGVTAYPFERREYTDHEIAAAEKFLEREKLCHRGDLVVMVAGIPPGQRSATNLMKIHMVGERESGVLSQRTGRRAPEVGGLGV